MIWSKKKKKDKAEKFSDYSGLGELNMITDRVAKLKKQEEAEEKKKEEMIAYFWKNWYELPRSKRREIKKKAKKF